MVSTINGDSNVPFYKELGNQGLKATDVPVVAFSVGEEELRGVDTKPLVGHLAAWNYFMSIKAPANDAFTKKWAAYAKTKNIAGHKDKPLTNDPMEATYIGIYMWKQAVEKAKSFDVDKVRAAMAGQTFTAPSGITSTMDAKNHHLHKAVFIGEVKADGQFNVVWKTKGPVKAQPWSPFIAGQRQEEGRAGADGGQEEVSSALREERGRLRGGPFHICSVCSGRSTAPQVEKLASDDNDEKIAAIAALVAEGDPEGGRRPAARRRKARSTIDGKKVEVVMNNRVRGRDRRGAVGPEAAVSERGRTSGSGEGARRRRRCRRCCRWC